MTRIRELYSYYLTTEPIGVREDGSEYEMFKLILPEDLHAWILEHAGCKAMHEVEGEKYTCLDLLLKVTGYIEGGRTT